MNHFNVASERRFNVFVQYLTINRRVSIFCFQNNWFFLFLPESIQRHLFHQQCVTLSLKKQIKREKSKKLQVFFKFLVSIRSRKIALL